MNFVYKRSLGLLYSQRINFIYWRGYRKQDLVNYKYVTELLGVDRKINSYKEKMYNSLFKRTNKEDIKKCLSLLKNVGYSSEYIYNHMLILTIPPSDLKNYLLFFQECGVYKEKIGLAVVSREHCMRVSISVLKLYQILPTDVNILDNFLFYLRIPRIDCNVETSDKDTLAELSLKVYHFYLMKELGVDEESMKRYRLLSNECVSFQRLKENMKFLRKTLGYNNEKIAQLADVLHYDPENITYTLGSPAGVHLKEVMFKDPSIMKLRFEKIREIDDILRIHGLDFSTLSKFSGVLHMENKEFFYRLCKLVKTPALNVFKNDPKLGTLLVRSRVAHERLNILKSVNMKCYSIFLLTCSNQSFLRHLLSGADQVSCGDISTYVSRKLGKCIEKTTHELRKNNYSRGVSIVAVQETLEFLLRTGFNDEEIFHSIQIVLYPRDVVESKLKELVMSSITVSDDQQIQVINKKFFLPLAMYMIEKEHDFSGAGVFGKSAAPESPSDYSTEIKLLEAC